ncbi:MAG: gliding motility lipoprotein GldH [Bacteroidia bacterium]|nr:gliding motility lipoprotein GldH [Bacteroidia bacterium]
MRILALAFLTCWGCEQFSEEVIDRKFPEKVWIYPDTVWGEVRFSTAGACRQIEMYLELEETYPWRNLYVLLWVQQPDGFRQASRIELVFSDSLGNWYRRDRRFRTFIARNVSFASAGIYRIGILPYIRQDTVRGIRRVGLYLYPCL